MRSEPSNTTPVLSLLGVYAMVRIALLVADVFSAQISYGGDLGGPLHSWDAHLYLEIAESGYPAVAPTFAGHLTYSTAGFEPLFPALIRLVALADVPYVAAALVVSVIAGAVATVLVWRIGVTVANRDVGWDAALLFAVFPGMGVVWGLPYSESVGLALVAASLLCMLSEKWFWAGVLAALATATSPMALPLALAPIVPAFKALRQRRLSPALLAMVMAPIGFLGYAGWLALRYHDLLFWWHLQNQAWSASVDFGRSLLRLLGHFWGRGYQGAGWLEWIGTLAVAAGVLAMWKAKLASPLNIYFAGVVVIMFVSNSLGFKPRLLTWAFPALMAVAAVARGRGLKAVVVLFACLLPIVFIAYTTLGDTMVQP